MAFQLTFIETSLNDLFCHLPTFHSLLWVLHGPWPRRRVPVLPLLNERGTGFTFVCSVLCSGGLHPGWRLATVDCVQFALWPRHSTSNSSRGPAGFQRWTTVSEHRPEGHLLRNRVQVRTRTRTRTNARYNRTVQHRTVGHGTQQSQTLTRRWLTVPD